MKDLPLDSGSPGTVRRASAELDGRAVATAVHVRSRDAKPDGKKGCRIAGRNSGKGGRNAHSTPDDHSKKIRIPLLGAGPRAAAPHIRHAVSGVEERLAWAAAAFKRSSPRPVLPVLSLAFFSTVVGPPILFTGPPSPPATSFGTALGATESGLGMCGVKRLFATLEQTMSLPRLTCPLTGTSLVASLTWAQGSCELPAAKPRTRRSLPPLRGAFLDHDIPRCRFPLSNLRPSATRPSQGGHHLAATH